MAMIPDGVSLMNDKRGEKDTYVHMASPIDVYKINEFPIIRKYTAQR